jgi:hypothetical protein
VGNNLAKIVLCATELYPEFSVMHCNIDYQAIRLGNRKIFRTSHGQGPLATRQPTYAPISANRLTLFAVWTSAPRTQAGATLSIV